MAEGKEGSMNDNVTLHAWEERCGDRKDGGPHLARIYPIPWQLETRGVECVCTYCLTPLVRRPVTG